LEAERVGALVLLVGLGGLPQREQQEDQSPSFSVIASTSAASGNRPASSAASSGARSGWLRQVPSSAVRVWR
jgi:hypothetical protein